MIILKSIKKFKKKYKNRKFYNILIESIIF